MNVGTMVSIVTLLTKNMCYVVYLWLKIVDLGTNCNFRGTNFTFADVLYQGQSAFP
jgi:hypothetical protein